MSIETEQSSSFPQAESMIETWLKMESNLQLEQFTVTRLNLKFTPFQEGEDIDAANQMNTRFSYDLRPHNTDQLKFRLDFRVASQQVREDGSQVGMSVDSAIQGYFRFENNVAEDQIAILSRVNGVSILYGLLRGIVSNATGCFPMGPVFLPMFMPQRIVAIVEQDKQRAIEKAQEAKAAKDIPPR